MSEPQRFYGIATAEAQQPEPRIDPFDAQGQASHEAGEGRDMTDIKVTVEQAPSVPDKFTAPGFASIDVLPTDQVFVTRGFPGESLRAVLEKTIASAEESKPATHFIRRAEASLFDMRDGGGSWTEARAYAVASERLP